MSAFTCRTVECPDCWDRLGDVFADFRDFIADLRDNADILSFGLTVGVCIGALATVGFAGLWGGM